MKKYILTTERLGLRNWLPSDLAPFSEMSQDTEVMRYFPKLLTKEESNNFISRMQAHFKDFGFCYFAVDILESEEFIGFVGMLHQTYESKYTPCIDIGWRLKRSAWGSGFATEAAKACLNFAFSELNLNEIYAIATQSNKDSEKVMDKLEMTFLGPFQHPKIDRDSNLNPCIAYKISSDQFVTE